MMRNIALKAMYAIAVSTISSVCLVALAQGNASPSVDFQPGPAAEYVKQDIPLGTGPFPAVMLSDPGLLSHTLYQPANLQSLNVEKLPVVVWGNGACVNTGNRFRQFLTEISSHGFLVIALGPIGPAEAESSISGRLAAGTPAEGSPAALLAKAGRLGPIPATGMLPGAFTTANQFADAIDWAFSENIREGSLLKNKIDIDNIAVMGQSCGGVQAIDAARDPRVKTLGVWNSGLFPDAKRMWPVAAARVRKEDIPLLKVSAIYVTGAPTDVAYKNADDDFERFVGVPVVRAWREKTGHSGTYRETLGGDFSPVAVAWLKWQLKGHKDASKMFVGADCGICQKSNWHIRKKNID
jgi:hypothetical protein